MSKGYFDFKQFRVYHNRCAQKVGTDGVLLGAWAKLDGAKRILDIGTGSGLLALMAAQRAPEAMITAIEIEPNALLQASENVKNSIFANRISVEEQNVLEYKDVSFDAILCNPPFYTEDTLPPDDDRALARNASSLPFNELVKAASRLLEVGGFFSVVLPMSAVDEFVRISLLNELYLCRRCKVKTVARKPAKRCLLTFSNKQSQMIEEKELILQEGSERSQAYEELARDFYL